LLTDKQTNRQTNKNRQKHNLLGGGNEIDYMHLGRHPSNGDQNT